MIARYKISIFLKIALELLLFFEVSSNNILLSLEDSILFMHVKIRIMQIIESLRFETMLIIWSLRAYI